MENEFMKGLQEATNISETENGALGYKTSFNALVDFNYKVASYRSKDEKDIVLDFKKIWNENSEYALKYLFFVRDVREGLGERRLFRICMKTIANDLQTIDSKKLFDWVSEYGRYDDLFIFFETELKYYMLEYIRRQLQNDILNMATNNQISLLAKWMPSINTSSIETRKLAKKFIDAYNLTDKQYRTILSGLRKYIDVTEIKLCANEWDKIKYENIPSQANLKYKDAFMKHDKERRMKYLENLKKGESKINAATLFPHDIVNKYSLEHVDNTLEALWKALPDYVKGESNTIVVRDGSGSMECGTLGNTSVRALDVATGLALYFAERSKGPFKNNFITFSNCPKLVNLSDFDNLRDKLDEIYHYDECSNTNIESVFDLILDVATQNKLKQKDIPNILIISDMEFDDATTGANKKLFDEIEAKFNAQGYKLPKLIFWNVNSRTNTMPVIQNDLGVSLVSGFSPAIVKMVLSTNLDPLSVILEQILSKRYEQVSLEETV